MGEAKFGESFVTHELDEAIAIQQCIVEAEEALSANHPRSESKQLIKRSLKDDQRYLKELQKLGQPHGATGKVEEVASGLKELMTQTSEKAASAESEAYEAQAVLVNLKRKQQDSGSAMIKIARAKRDTEMRQAASAFQKATKTSAQELADDLAQFAVAIATMDGRTAGQQRQASQAAR